MGFVDIVDQFLNVPAVDCNVRDSHRMSDFVHSPPLFNPPILAQWRIVVRPLIIDCTLDLLSIVVINVKNCSLSPS